MDILNFVLCQLLPLLVAQWHCSAMEKRKNPNCGETSGGTQLHRSWASQFAFQWGWQNAHCYLHYVEVVAMNTLEKILQISHTHMQIQGLLWIYYTYIGVAKSYRIDTSTKSQFTNAKISPTSTCLPTWFCQC